MGQNLKYWLKVITLFLAFGYFIASCSKNYYTPDRKWNLSVIYNPTKSRIHPSFKIYHNTRNTSVLFAKIYTSELYFQPLGQNGEQISELSVNYTLVQTGEDKHVVADSGTFNTTIYKKSAGKSYLTQIPIKAEQGKTYHLKIITRDKYRKNFNLTFIDVDKRKDFGQQFFNVTQVDGNPLFKNVVIGESALRILHSQPASDQLFISYYKNDSSLPKPTFAVSQDEILYSRPDSLYIIKYTPELAFSLVNEGVYFLQFDTTLNEGISLTKFNPEFPKIQNPVDLIEPLAYITTTAEYNKLKSSKNYKLAADKYWMRVGGGTDRGKELIRIYYNRVYFSNYYFSTTKPGWKTDRGMVYIVYGPPHNLKKTADTETWYYYHQRGGESISFSFKYNPSKYFLNQYKLVRSESHTWHWREAVYAWNNGQIFLQDY
jgi:GWxTD domain-containing protein